MFKQGNNVKIDARVYEYKWDGWKELWNKYGHHNLVVDRVIDLSDTDQGDCLVIVGYPYANCNKSAVKASYLSKLSDAHPFAT